MTAKNLFFISSFVGFFITFSSCKEQTTTSLPEDAVVKVALREVGNQLLLLEGDSTSRILPVQKMTSNRYVLQFENPLAFDPDDLYQAMESVVAKTSLPNNYLLEVTPCQSNITVYSYQVHQNMEESIIPCGGRLLPKDCYDIYFQFKDLKSPYYTNQGLFWTLVFLVVIFVAFVFISRFFTTEHHDEHEFKLGMFTFLPEQLKLIKEAEEIKLSNKEVELLSILIAHPNEVVKREELSKRVWEDRGVIVGRSLDTYISKLRKKLQADSTIKITNVHGVGYKLEV